MHYRRYALVAAGMLATGLIVTAPIAGATLQDNHQGTVTINVVIPESAHVPDEPSPVAPPASSQSKSADHSARPALPPTFAQPSVAPTTDVTLPSKEQSVDPAPAPKESAVIKQPAPSTPVTVAPTPRLEVEPTPSPAPSELASEVAPGSP